LELRKTGVSLYVERACASSGAQDLLDEIDKVRLTETVTSEKHLLYLTCVLSEKSLDADLSFLRLTSLVVKHAVVMKAER